MEMSIDPEVFYEDIKEDKPPAAFGGARPKTKMTTELPKRTFETPRFFSRSRKRASQDEWHRPPAKGGPPSYHNEPLQHSSSNPELSPRRKSAAQTMSTKSLTQRRMPSEKERKDMSFRDSWRESSRVQTSSSSSSSSLATEGDSSPEKPTWADKTARFSSVMTRKMSKLRGKDVKETPLPKVAPEYKQRKKKSPQ